jgi:hypothetical protein
MRIYKLTLNEETSNEKVIYLSATLKFIKSFLAFKKLSYNLHFKKTTISHAVQRNMGVFIAFM